MYLVGAEHPHKHAARRALETAIQQGHRLATDAEVMQEILHRYSAIRRLEAVRPALGVLKAVVDEVFPVEAEDVESAADILAANPSLSARDALHIGIMRRYGVSEILSFDTGFDGLPDVMRICS
jgi:hypothetical protein